MKQISQVKKEIKQAATEHLNTKNAREALSHFTKDIVAVSNDKIFTSIDSLAIDVKEYYNILKEVNEARWKNIHIQVINENAATFTAEFIYTFTNNLNEIVRLKGVWTALLVRDKDKWKIRLQHESFTQS